MQILIIGKTYCAKELSDKLAENKNDIVFTTAKDTCANSININPKDKEELKDFIVANDVSMGIIIDDEYLNYDYSNILNETECLLLCPGSDSKKLFTSLSAGKKFAYKNKIQTPKFAVFEKPAQALDYIQTAQYPIIVMPDFINRTEPPFIAETRKSAAKKADELFQTGNKKVLIENFVSGVEYTKYILQDGFSVIDFLDTISYFDEISTNNPTCMSYFASKVNREIMPILLDAFMEDGVEYQGVLGLSFIKNRNGEVYFSRFKPFISDLDINILTNTLNTNIKDILYSCLTGTLAENFSEDVLISKYVITKESGGEFITSSANTMTKAIEIGEALGMDKKELDEAIKQWKL